MSIDRIERERIKDQKICLDRSYCAWKIMTNFPRGGEIGFGATGFTQTLRGNALISDQQQLPISDRAGLNLAELARELARDDDERHDDNGAKTF